MNFLAWIDQVGDALRLFVHHYPVAGALFLLVAEESGIPLPIPGDVYIAYIGYEVSRHIISYILAFILIIIAVLIGSSILYLISFRYGKRFVQRFGKYIHLNEKKLNFIENKFRKYGPIVIIVGRHVPGFRIPVTVFSGLSKVPYKTFIVSEFISIVIWIALFMETGLKLGSKVQHLFQHNYSFLFFLIIPTTLTLLTIFFGKFIPEEE